MAEEPSRANSPQPTPFLEVKCKSSGKITRFAAGTKAGFAVSLINRKSPFASHIEAVKEGEEPINFGPDAALVDYGNGWKLQTVTEVDHAVVRRGEVVQPIKMRIPTATSFDGSRPPKRISEPGISSLYIGKILLAFFLIFLLGGIFTLALENLPRLILLINSYMKYL